MARDFDKRREEVINYITGRLTDASDSRAAKMVLRYCRQHLIPATDQDIQDIASEAIRRRLLVKIKDLIQSYNQLEQRVTTIENQRQQIIDKFAEIDGRLDQAQAAFINLRDRVNNYHP